ncbi:MAG: type VI secretion system protein TssR domain-containing protein [Bacteroidota bacterium]|jgi:hypothetical protein
MKKLICTIKYLTVISLLIFSSTLLIAQVKVEGSPIGKMTPIKLPKMYEQPTGAINKKGAERTASGNNWIVYSDRENNKTYCDKNCTKEYGSVNFMQPLMVADETDNEVRVVEYDPSDFPVMGEGKKAIFKTTAIDKGWIKKSKLLLWSVCMVNDTTKYVIKAVAVKKLGENQDPNNLINRGRVLDCYDGPFIDKQYLNKKDSKLFEYLFVLKENKESQMVLLSRRYKTNASNYQQDVLGWVPAKQIHKWDNALCLRINFEPAAVNERKDKKIEANFFRNREDAKKFRNGQSVISLPFEYGSPDKIEGDNPYYYGFPIIEDAKDDAVIFKTGYVTNTMDSKGKSIFNNYQKAEFDEKFEILKKQRERVNIIFAIDGNAVRNFSDAIKNFVKNGPYFRSDDLTTNKYSVGAYIYNGINSSNEEKFWRIPLTTDAEDFCSRLDNFKDRPINSERSNEGAPLFEALVKSCNEFSKEKTNIIIVAGLTKGTDLDFKTTAMDKIVEKHVKLSMIQLLNRGGSMYDGFLLDAKWLLQNSADKLDIYYARKTPNGSSYKVKSKLEPENDNKFVLKFSCIPGEIHVSDEGEANAFKASVLTKGFLNFIKAQENNLNDYLNAYKENTITGRKEELLDENAIQRQKQLAALLADAGITGEDVNKLSEQENFQLFIGAYTSIENKQLANPLLLRTLFMQKTEFGRLIDAFEQIKEATSSNGQRTAVTNAFRQIIYSYKGSMDPKEVSNFNADDIFKLITSLPKTNNKLFQISIKNLEDVKKTSEDDIRVLSQDFNNIARELQKVKKSKIYHYDTDDETFYWVPENIFKIGR